MIKVKRIFVFLQVYYYSCSCHWVDLPQIWEGIPDAAFPKPAESCDRYLVLSYTSIA